MLNLARTIAPSSSYGVCTRTAFDTVSRGSQIKARFAKHWAGVAELPRAQNCKATDLRSDVSMCLAGPPIKAISTSNVLPCNALCKLILARTLRLPYTSRVQSCHTPLAKAPAARCKAAALSTFAHVRCHRFLQAQRRARVLAPCSAITPWQNTTATREATLCQALYCKRWHAL
jgi:hypothetical protein